MLPKAFLFDFDGTLMDTEAVWTRAIVDMVVSRGGKTTFRQILPSVIGRNWLEIDKWLHAKFPELGNTTPMQDAIELRRHYNRRIDGDPRALRINSSIDFFRKAAELATCAIVTGSPRDDVAAMIALCGLAEKTAFVLGAGEYERGKPAPDCYIKAADLLGVCPEDCVVIEDSAVGVQAGVAAGMRVIALDRRKDMPQVFSGQTWLVHDLSEFDFEKEFAK